MQEPKGRITIVKQAYHQIRGEEAHAIDSRYSMSIFDDEQVYSRRTKVGESWDTINLGWVEEPSMIFIENEETKFIQTIPTEEEREEADKKIIEIAFDRNNSRLNPTFSALQILPGDTLRICPSSDFVMLKIKSQHGEAKYTLTVFPK